MRAAGPPPLRHPDRSPGGRLRLSGRLLQPTAAPLRPGSAQPGRLRKEPSAPIHVGSALTCPPDRGNSSSDLQPVLVGRCPVGVRLCYHTTMDSSGDGPTAAAL